MRRGLLIICTAASIALAATAATARADLLPGLLGGNCGATAPVFAPWGDRAAYYLARNGGFESGATGWSLSGGAAVVSGGDPWNLSGAGSHSLLVPTGGSASISVCYGLTYPAVRFVVAGHGGNATVHVRVIAHGLLGVLSVLDGGRFTVGPGWSPSPKLSTLLSALGAPLGTKSLELQFTVESGAANFDDLYVDPFLSKS